MAEHVLITGGSGFIGKALSESMLEQGYLVTVLSRDAAITAVLLPAGLEVVDNLENREGTNRQPYDIIINLAGETIDQYWTESLKTKIVESRREAHRKIVNYIASAKTKPKLLIAASGVGYYGTALDKKFTEKSEPSAKDKKLFIVSLCQEIERSARNAEEFGVRTCFLRTGMVLEKDGGLLARLLTPYKFGIGSKFGQEEKWISWIHRTDLIGAIFHIISHKHIHGPVNITSPNPVTNKEFSEIISQISGRSFYITLPEFYIKLGWGQMGQEMLLNGQNVVPKVLMDGNFNYKYPTLQDALKVILYKKQ